MAPTTYQFQPDYAVPPGWVLEERLEANGISQAEFARRCGRSPKFISDIIAGKAPVEAKTALQFEKVLGISANIWLGIEKRYRLHQMREAEAREAEASADWASSFPVKELVERGAISKLSSVGELVTELLAFFGVASTRAWQSKYGAANVAYRHSPSFKSDETALAAWLRLAEIEAERQESVDYDRAAFKAALRNMRRLTCAELPKSLADAQQLCKSAGVALVLVRPFPKAHLSGAAWWLTPRKPVIALSARHKSDDHLWFSLFHEAAHIMLHSKKDVFVDGPNGDADAEEAEANEWAARFLLPQSAWNRFVASGEYRTGDAICGFAAEQGIAPGIIVGRLQHEGRLPWNSRMNRLKVRLEWRDDRK
ncbi:MAG: HigA family addiction module antitoxin [Caldilineaceae bacterium]|nr:HigA family addiction module antitoxin [Caldilineaceae bacterium]